MLTQEQVDRWLAELVERLRDAFDERLLFVGHHGSWARGEAGPESDIDTIVVLDEVQSEELDAYRDVVAAMPEARRLASSAFVSLSELRAWPRRDLPQVYYGCQPHHGTLDGLGPAGGGRFPGGRSVPSRGKSACGPTLSAPPA